MEICEEQADVDLDWAEIKKHDTTDDRVRKVHVKFHRATADG